MMTAVDAQMYGLVVEVAASAVVADAAADEWDAVGLPRVFVLGRLLQRPNGRR
jgi:hypothetical protein